MPQEFKLHEAFTDPGAEEYKKKGNEAFARKDWDEAIKNYNKAIQLDPNQASFYSNRAACWSSKGNHESALSDAKKCLEADPGFVKGYSRKGKALFDLGKLDEAEAAYQEGLSQAPANPGCETGLADVKKAKEQARRSASMFSGFGGGGAAGGGAGGAMAGLGKKFMETMKKGGLGGRMQMYAVVMIGYFMYNKYAKGSSNRSEASSHDTAEDYGGDDDAGMPSASSTGGAATQRVKRGFAEVAGSWVSYLEAGPRGDNLMLLLHGTSSSAEVEFGSAFPLILEKAPPQPPGGFRLLAPDRPCHGFSPCPASGKAAPGWLNGLLAPKPKAKRLTLVASGRSAARQALAAARERLQPSRLLLLDPRASSPSAPTAAEVHKWLQQHSSAMAVADAARWAASASTSEDAEVEDDDKLVATGLPDGSRVTLLYSEGAKEDVDLQEEIEGIGLPVRTRRSEGSLDEAMAEEAWKLLSAEDSDVEE